MASCPKCNASLPKGVQFCLQCGAPLEKTAPPSPGATGAPKPPQPTSPAPAQQVGSKRDPSAPKPATPGPRTVPPPVPVRGGAPPPTRAKSEAPSPAVQGPKLSLLEEAEEKRRRFSSIPGGVTCRFCKGPLDLEGDFCEQCGAPVEDAAPPGLVKPKPTSAPPVGAATPPSTPREVRPGVSKAASPPATSPKTTATPPAVKPASAASVSPSASRLAQASSGTGGVVPPGASAKSSATVLPVPKTAPVAPATKVALTEPPTTTAEPLKKPSLIVPVIIGLGLVVLGGGAAAFWYLNRPKPVPENPPAQVGTPPPANIAAPGSKPERKGPPPAGNVPTSNQPRTARAAKPEPTPSPATATANPRTAQILSLQNLARDAYAKGNYADPPDASAVAYSKRVLAIAPADDYSRKLLDNSVIGGKYQVQQAISKNDFATAHRVANALALLLPGRSDINGLQEDIAKAEKTEGAARNAKPVGGPQVAFQVYHMHSEKAPADSGPYCLGTLSVSAQHMRFTGASASDGQVHNLVFECADIRETKKNARVASKQGGFHVRTSSANFNFAPKEPAAAVVPALASACSK